MVIEKLFFSQPLNRIMNQSQVVNLPYQIFDNTSWRRPFSSYDLVCDLAG